MNQDYDIVIIGAGLVGSSFVLALQNQGLSIAVLEKNIPTAVTNPQANSRPISLAYSSKVILDTLGIWTSLADDACPITKVHVSQQGSFGHTVFSAEQQKVAALGYVVPFTKLHQTLYQTMAAQPQVNIIPIIELQQIQCEESQALVNFKTVNGEQTLNTKLVIAADGTQSQCRQLLKIKTQVKNHNEVAMTAKITLAKAHQHTAYERFTKNGTLAILPLPNAEACRLVWTMSQQVTQTIKTITDDDLLTQVQSYFGTRLGKMLSLQRTGEYPLQTVLPEEQVRDRFVLIGNAAHTIYPIAAQGFNLGLRDVAVLSEVLVTARESNEEIGSVNVLSRYAKWRQQDQHRIIKLTNSIVDLFELKLPLLTPLRSSALLAIDLIPPLKRRMANRTMGVAGKMSKLARGIGLNED